MAAVLLQVHWLLVPYLHEYMMTSSYALFESQAQQECAQVIEAYISISPSTQDTLSQLIVLGHLILLGLL